MAEQVRVTAAGRGLATRHPHFFYWWAAGEVIFFVVIGAVIMARSVAAGAVVMVIGVACGARLRPSQQCGRSATRNRRTRR